MVRQVSHASRSGVAKLWRASASVIVLFSAVGCSKIWIRHDTERPEPPLPHASIAPQQKFLPVVHTVTKRGETLSAIAKRYTGAASNWKRIESANPKLNPHVIRMGDKITVPGELLLTSLEPSVRASLDRAALDQSGTKQTATKRPGTKQTASKELERARGNDAVAPKRSSKQGTKSAKLTPKRSSKAAKPGVPASVRRPTVAVPDPQESAAPEPSVVVNKPIVKSEPVGQAAEVTNPLQGEMLSETTDLLPEYATSATAPRSAAVAKELTKRGIAKKAKLASDLIDPARLSKQKVSKPNSAIVALERSQTVEASPEIASTFLTCRADRCNIRVASE